MATLPGNSEYHSSPSTGAAVNRGPSNPLACLIRDRLHELKWSQAELCRQLADRGISVSPSAVHYWCAGAGVAESKREALAAALDIPLSRIMAASLRRASGKA